MKMYFDPDTDESVLTFKDEDGIIQIVRGKKVNKRTIPRVRLSDGKILEPETK